MFNGAREALDVAGGVLDGARADVGVASHGPVKGRLLLAVGCVCHGRGVETFVKENFLLGRVPMFQTMANANKIEATSCPTIPTTLLILI